MQNIAITGASGFIGKNLAKSIAQTSDYNIYLIVRKSSDLREFGEFKNIHPIIYEGSFDSLNDFFSQVRIDVVIHLATLYIFDHKPQNIDDLIDSNIKFGCHLLEAMALNNCQKFINAASYIQNYFSDEYYPSCLYAATKQSMMDIIDYYSVQRNINAITLKLYDVYGANDPRKKILNLFKEYQANNDILPMSLGNQEIRLTHISDIITAFLTALNMLQNCSKCNHDTYYVAAESYSLRELASIFEEVSGKPLKINWGALPYRKNQPMKSFLGKILPNWQPIISLRNGIKITLK